MKMPRVYQKNWTLIQRLDQLLTYAVNDEPPLYFDTQSLIWTTPPILHQMCDTYVMQSATADKTQIKSLITLANDVDFYAGDGKRVEHHQDTTIYKVVTGRYVRSSCFTLRF